MIVIKRRLIFWLVRAYLKRWGRILFVCFLCGLGIFFLLKSSFPYIIAAFTGVSKETDGIAGIYTLNTLPNTVVKDISKGLTKIDDAGVPKPDIASSWDIKDSGKTYVFHLKKGLYFVDGTPLTSKEIQFTFADVKTERPDSSTIIFKLKDSYSPFLTTVSRPIFKEGYVGIGPYRIKKVQSNGPFLQSLTLTSATQNPALKIYVFYPTQDSLKVAFALGEVTTAVNLSDITFQKTSFDKYPHTHIIKSTNYNVLIALFYNSQDKNLSDKKLRDAFSYALPNTFSQGERAVSSIPPFSNYYNNGIDRKQDFTHANLLLEASLGSDAASYPKLTISTLAKYKFIAIEIQKVWKQLHIATDIKVVDSIPQVFQVYLGDFTVPQDPDQYTLWHSFQENNITAFKSTRIDTLLEDGRKTNDTKERVRIYQDFQKYLQDEQPASFLYFPYNYSVSRK
ncbi:MAG TPA: ABC transporter substrate-binding protein [Candidatus Eisenbacteria bacterium]|nr:ABC transporter substrate-binding protein [Candidatus Eisenbacteria bacterium]